MKQSTFPAFALIALVLSAGCVRGQEKDTKAPPASTSQPADKAAAQTKNFTIEGHYVEACTCKSACAAEITGEDPGCDAVAAYQFDKGAYDGQDFSDTRLAWAVDHGVLKIYIDAPDDAKRKAVEAFGRAAFAPYGKLDSVAQAKIEISGTDGSYTVKVNEGKTLSLQTAPVLGGDQKTVVEIKNSQNKLSPTLSQGRCLSGTYSDGEHKVTIEKGRNSFFNTHLKATGKA